MPTKRTPLNRHRKPLFDGEALALFVELENTPARQRHNRKFNDRDYELHKRLGLGAERLCSQVSVLGREAALYRPPGYPQHDDWMRVRAVRLQLLAATEPDPRSRAGTR